MKNKYNATGFYVHNCGLVAVFHLKYSLRFDLPRHPLAHLRPKDFPKIGDEEFVFESDNEDTDEDIPDSRFVEDAGGEALEPVDDQTSTAVEAGITRENIEERRQIFEDDSENTITNGSDKSPDFGNDFEQGDEEDAPLLTNRFTSIN